MVVVQALLVLAVAVLVVYQLPSQEPMALLTRVVVVVETALLLLATVVQA
jgi:hypothetical protein